MTKTLPIPDNSCGYLVCIDGIEHIKKQFDFIEEANRILTKQGEIIISTPNISSLRSRWKWFWTGHHHKCNAPLDENNPNFLHHLGMISFTELRYMLHINGFKINEAKTNRIKPISLVYGIFLPLVYLSTFWVYFKTGRREGTQEMHNSVFKQMFKKEILFGETLILKAIKISSLNLIVVKSVN